VTAEASCDSLALESYRLHNAGTLGQCGWHAGPPFELIARPLRQRDVAMVTKVYRRLKPDIEERDPS
jgi:hypothetical protein